MSPNANAAIRILNQWDGAHATPNYRTPQEMLIAAGLTHQDETADLRPGRPDGSPLKIRVLTFEDGSRAIQFSGLSPDPDFLAESFKTPWAAVPPGLPLGIVPPNDLVAYELFDPLAGEYGVQYHLKDFGAMVAKADELGATRFTGVTADRKQIQYLKRDGLWLRQTVSDILQEAQDGRAATARRLAADLSFRIQDALRTDLQDAGSWPEELKEAFAEMGIDPAEDAEHRAAHGISARNIAYADACAAAKYEKRDALPRGDIRARLAEMAKPEPGVLLKEIAEQWARLDAREFSKLRSTSFREDAAVAMATNCQANEVYASTLAADFPDIAATVSELDRANERLSAIKAITKDRDAQAMGLNEGEPSDRRTSRRPRDTELGM